MENSQVMSRFGLVILFSFLVLSGCLEDSKTSTPTPSPQIGSPSVPIESPNQNPETGTLKVLAAPATENLVAMKNDGKSKDHCTDGKGKDGDKSKNCEEVENRGPDSNSENPNANEPKEPGNKNPKDLGNITQINLIVKEVSAHSSTLDWVIINSTRQTLDLLSLSQNAAAILAKHPLPPGAYDSIRVKLDSGSTIVVDGESHSLDTPSALKSGIKLNGTFSIEKGYVTSITLNFDPDKSIQKTGNGKYKLKPVVKIAGVQEDVVAPNIAITSPNFKYTNIPAQLIRLEYSDEFLDLSSLAISINGTDSKSLFSITEESAEYTKTWADGTYSVQSSIADLNKNLGQAEGVEFIVDTQVPFLTFNNQNHYFNTKTPLLSVQATDTLSGIDPAAFQVMISSNDVTSAFSFSGSELSGTPTLNEGVYQILVSAKDKAKNEKQISGQFVVDVTPPILTQILPSPNSIHYTNTLPITLDFTFSSNERLSEAKINEANLEIAEDMLTASGPLVLTTAGTFSNTLIANDLAKNPTSLQTSTTLIFDNIAPTISLGLQNQTQTAQNSINLPVTITDSSPTFTEIKFNGQPLFITGSKQFDASVHLNLEGANQIEVISKDAAGNVSATSQLTVIRDTTAPFLAQISPADGSKVYRIQFPVSGQANEPLSSASVNSVPLTISADKMSFSGTYIAPSNGSHTLNFIFADTLGNSRQFSVSIDVEDLLLVPALVSIEPTSNGRTVLVKGSVGSVRPGANIKITTGMFSFNTAETTAAEDASFSVEMDYFSEAQLKVTDSQTGEVANMTLTFTAQTIFSGLVKDVDSNPLPGATITLGDQTKISDGNGAFSFPNAPSGVQTLSIDGRTIPQSTTGPNRKFSETKVTVNIPYGFNVPMERPIYLTPLYLDGSQTSITASTSAVVESERAPGVKIEIPAGTAEFPNGGSSGEINIVTINAERVTISAPQEAQPTEVVSLEPSGLSFKERVPVTLPNSNDLPPGTAMAVLSMNSSTGKWELDGMAEVTADGSSVKTREGEGISHFSAIYAIPTRPIIETVKNPSLLGVDISSKALKSSIALPSFKSLGKSVTPRLIYNSSWANPTALVSNLIELPSNLDTVVTIDKTTNSQIIKEVKSCVRDAFSGALTDICATKDILFDAESRLTGTVTSKYVPDSIRSQFFVGNLASHYTVLQDSRDLPSNTRDRYIPGSFLANSAATQMLRVSGIPSKTQMTYAVPLKNSSTSESLASGIYPTLARYEIQLKNLILRSLTETTNVRNSDGQIVYTDKMFYGGLDRQAQLLRQILPLDVVDTVLVQNKMDSPFGRGWHFSGAQRIINPQSNNLMIEESDGSVATYSINDTASTILAEPRIDYSSRMDLNSFPDVTALAADWVIFGQALGQFDKIDRFSRNGNSYGITRLGNIQRSTGKLFNQGWHNCAPNINFESSLHNFSKQGRLGGLLQAANGSFIGLNSNEHQLFSLANQQFTKIGGATASPDSLGNILYHGFRRFSMPRADLNTYCSSNLNTLCSTDSITPKACNNYCYPGRPTCNFPPLIEPVGDSIGSLGVSGRGGDGSWDHFTQSCGFFSCTKFFPNTPAFNNPSDIAFSPQGKIVYADTGNNIVREVDPAARTTKTIAGGGNGFLYGIFGNFYPGYGHNENVRGIDAALSMPRAIAYDSQGNLFIAESNGKIRILTTDGLIRTFAGKNSQLGGVLTFEGDAKTYAINDPRGLAIDNQNLFLYVSDAARNIVTRIDMQTMLATRVAGSGNCAPWTQAEENKPAAEINLCSPTQISLDSDRNLIIVDTGNKRIRKVAFNASSTPGLAKYLPTKKDNSVITKDANGEFQRRYRNGAIDYFDTEGYQTKTVDELGRTTNFIYDSQKRMDRIVDPVGQQIQFYYSGNKIDRVIDPAGRITHFSFVGNTLSNITYEDASQIAFQYDANGLLKRETNQRGNSKEYSYNKWDRLVSVKNYDGQISYMNDYQNTTVVNSFTDGTTGQLINRSFENPAGYSSIKDPKGNETQFITDYMGNITAIKSANGVVTQIRMNPDGLPLEIIGPTDNHIKMSYDPLTRDLLTKTDLTLGTTEAFQYDTKGNVISKTNARGKTSTSTFDSITGLKLSDIFPEGQSIEYTYYPSGLLKTRTVRPTPTTAVTSTLEYDSRGNLTKEISSDGRSKQFSADSAGNLIQMTEISAAGTAITTYQYDAFNRLNSVKTPKNEITTYTYLPTGELIQINDPNEKIRTFAYDTKGRVIKKTDPLGFSHEFNYDGNDNLIYEKDPNGNIKTFNYDELNRLTTATLPDDHLAYQYDLRGDVSSISNNNSSIVYSRNSQGWIIGETVSGAGSVSSYPQVPIEYNYNEVGSRTALITAYGSMSYGYDNSGRLVAMANSWGQNFSFAYDNANRLIQLTRPGSSSQFTFLASGSINSIEHMAGGETKSFARYNYDLRGFPSQKRQPAFTSDYGYDLNGQLISSTGPAPEGFAYDKIGNRISDQGGLYTYDPIGSQRLIEDYRYTYTYDNNGNLTQKIPKLPGEKSYQYVYSSRNQLIEINILLSTFGQVEKRISFTYDANGRRMEKKITDLSNSSQNRILRYVYDGENILFQFDDNGNILSRYAHSSLMSDDVLSAQISTAGTQAGLSTATGNFYYLKDSLGTVTDVISGSGQIIQSYDYSAFGKILSIRDGSGNTTTSPVLKAAFTFTGREWDDESGLYYYRARYYDPNIGRFLQGDPHPGSLQIPITVNNKYDYVGNLPTILRDPSGKFWPIVIGAIIGAVIGAIDASINGGNFLERVLRGAIGGALFGVAFMINPAAASIALGVSVIGASATSGNFFKNLNDNSVKDGALAIVGAGIANEIDLLIQTPIVGTLFTGLGVAAFYIGATNTIIGLNNAACDPENGGAYRSDFCSISRGANGN